MKLKLARCIMLFSLFIFLASAATISTAYDGIGSSICECDNCGECPQGELFISNTIINPSPASLVDTVHISAETYNGVQYLSSNGELFSYDNVNFSNGCVDMHQYVDYSYDSQRTLTTYDTIAVGSGSATAYIVASGSYGYSYQDALANGSTYAGLTQQYYSNNQFQYEVGFAAGTNNCSEGEVYLYGYYDGSGYYHPLIEPICVQPGDDSQLYAYAHANATNELHVNSSVETDMFGWFSMLDVSGSGVYDVFATSNQNMSFNTTIGVS